MAELLTRISRPQRWDVPFGTSMSESDVDHLLTSPPFSTITASRFPPAIPLRGVLVNDTRIRKYTEGDIIVREGDYGNSAFLIMSGSVRVILD